jgi:recombination protein RecT
MSESRALAPVDRLSAQVAKMEGEFAKALPKHIPSAKFVRSVQTAIKLNPGIASCEPASVMGSCIKAAADGLILDGREAALVMYGNKAQYMPMVAGVIKRLVNSGNLSTINAHVVYQNDVFEYVLGDEERIIHKPTIIGERGPLIAVYAIATMKDGTKMRRVMAKADVEKVRMSSRSKDNGPWKSWYEEMARKTVIRNLAKYLPASADLGHVFEDDDADFDPEYTGEEDAPKGKRGQKKQGAAAAALAEEVSDQAPLGRSHDAETGEIIEATYAEVEAVEAEPVELVRESVAGDVI